MRAVDLEWRVGKAGEHSLRAGDVLYYAFFGQYKRFCIQECYQRQHNGLPSPTLYVVKDAHRITDAEVSKGASSPVVYRSEDAQQCVDWALAQPQ